MDWQRNQIIKKAILLTHTLLFHESIESYFIPHYSKTHPE